MLKIVIRHFSAKKRSLKIQIPNKKKLVGLIEFKTLKHLRVLIRYAYDYFKI